MAARSSCRDAVGVERAQRRLARSSGTILIAASTATQFAKEIPALGHGVLTYSLLAGLGLPGAAPKASVNARGQITINALLGQVADLVPELTAKYHASEQHPVQASTGQDFPLVVLRR